MNVRLEWFLRDRIPGARLILNKLSHRRYIRDNMKFPRERASLEVWNMIPKEQKTQVFKGTASAEIEPACLGNIIAYKNLAEVIPETWTVIDFGCSYNAQSYLFQNHLRHIAVDYHHDYNQPGEDKEHWKAFRFMAPNCELFEMSIQEFIKKHLKELDLDTTFAICSYVPDDNAVELVRRTFHNVFAIYPGFLKRKCLLCGSEVSINKRNGIYYYEPHMSKRNSTDKCCEWLPVSKEVLNGQV